MKPNDTSKVSSSSTHFFPSQLLVWADILHLAVRDLGQVVLDAKTKLSARALHFWAFGWWHSVLLKGLKFQHETTFNFIFALDR